MNKSLKGLLVAVVAFSNVYASESIHKTHLNTRLHVDKVAAATTFHGMTADKDKDRWGGNLEITGFYARTVNGSHLGKNFGANGTDSVTVISGANDTIKALKANHPNVVSGLLLPTYNNTTALAGTLRFAPRQVMYGGRLDYHHRLDQLLDGLYVAANVSLMRVENSVNMKIEKPADQVDSTSARIKLEQLFSGQKITRAAAEDNNLTELKYARMCKNSKTGLSDIEGLVGYNFIENEDCHAGVKACVVLPTSSKADPEYLFGARTGEGKFGIGAGLDGSAVLWKEGDECFKVLGSANYRYLFSGKERRTFGLNNVRYYTGSVQDVALNPVLSQYYPVATKGQKGLQPLANVSTLKVDVKAVSLMDGTIMFAYNNGGFCLDFGYNLFWKEAERTVFPTTCTSGSSADAWVNDKYALVSSTYDVQNDFPNAATDFLTNVNNTTTKGYIQESDLYKEGAEAAAQLVHKVFVGAGYTTKTWDYPVMVGAGVSYDIPSSNRDAAEGYAFWAKAGVSF